MTSCRACGAPIRWVRTLNEKPMPLDDEPNDEGNVELVNTPAGPRARVLSAKERGQANLFAIPRWMPHHATCPSWAGKDDDDRTARTGQAEEGAGAGDEASAATSAGARSATEADRAGLEAARAALHERGLDTGR